jgi:hypothetical protein
MPRLALAASLLALSLAPALANGYGPPQGYDAPRMAPAHRHHRAYRTHHGPRVQPVSYGVPTGDVYHAWMPRNERLPIYNVPPPFFPED